MVDWISENRVLLLGIMVVVGIFGFALSQKPATNTNAVASFKRIDQNSKMLMGNPKAKVSIIQYSDFLCPSCSYVSTQVMPQIEKDYVQTGKVQLEFRPMAFIAEGSTQAGMGAYCAVDQNKFWQYHDAIYGFTANKILNEGKNPQRDTIVTPDIIKSLAAQAGLDPAAFNSCYDSGKHLADITNATNKANGDGITGTPYIMVNGQQVTGNPSLQTIEAMIKAAE